MQDPAAFVLELRRHIRGEADAMEPMSGHTTFGLGGPADVFVRASCIDDLVVTLQMCREHEVPVWPLGSGSNLLVSDLGVRGAVVLLSGDLARTRIDQEMLIAGAGAQLSSAISASASNGLSGLHNVYGVPGTVGGSVFMNAGTRYGSISDTIAGARLVYRDGTAREVQPADLGLAYRHSALQDLAEPVFVVEASFLLTRSEPAEVKRELSDMAEARRKSQPLNWRSCGCIFKNPPSGSAGKIIDDAGLKGFSVGGVSVSERHANFFVTRGNATAADVYRLVREVQRRVREATGADLELEMQLMGEWPDE